MDILENTHSEAVCTQCGLPLPPTEMRRERLLLSDLYCCYGCYLTHSLIGSMGEESAPVLFLARLGFAAFLSMNVMTLSWALYGDRLPFLFPVDSGSRQWITYLIFALSVPVYLLIGIPFLRNALREFHQLHPGVDSLIALGTTSAFVYSIFSTFTGRQTVYYDTATMVLVLVTLGRYLEANAKVRSASALRALFARNPPIARVVKEGGTMILSPNAVVPGDLVKIFPGDMVPVDGEIQEGESSIDESVLTGESLPVTKRRGDQVVGGSTNCDGHLLVVARRTATDSALSMLEKLTRGIQQGRSPLQLTADQITRVFVPAVLVLALFTSVAWGSTEGPARGMLNGLAVLLIACPCALGIGSTLAGAIGYTTAARRGVLLKSLSVLETAAGLDTVFFDKTGTITEGKLAVSAFHLEGARERSENEVLQLAMSLEEHSEHSAGRAIIAYATSRGIRALPVQRSRIIPGEGIEGDVRSENGCDVHVKITKGITRRIEFPNTEVSIDSSKSYVILNDVIAGIFVFSDRIRQGAAPAIESLRSLGVYPCIVSGDAQQIVTTIASQLGNELEGKGDLTPAEKTDLIFAARSTGARPAMVGDGLNDAPALAAATVGISLRSGTDLAKVAADVTVMDDDLRRIPWLVVHGRRVRKIIRWNFLWAFVYNIIGIALAMAGYLEPVLAAAAMVASSILVIFNSSRLASDQTS